MEIVEEIELRRGGGFGGLKDTSDDLSKQNYAERLILNQTMLEAMATLKVARKVDGTWTGGSILLSKEDIPDYFKNGNEGMNGACHEINKVFVAAGFPTYATSLATENAKRTTVTRKKGKHAEQQVKTVIADRIRIYRISEDFQIDRYAHPDSKKVQVEGCTPYHKYTKGVYLRTQRWLKENVSEMKDTLYKLGYS